MRESESLLWEMLESVDLFAAGLDREGRITFCNDHLLEATGLWGMGRKRARESPFPIRIPISKA